MTWTVPILHAFIHCGSKMLKDSQLKTSPSRWIISRIYRRSNATSVAPSLVRCGTRVAKINSFSMKKRSQVFYDFHGGGLWFTPSATNDHIDDADYMPKPSNGVCYHTSHILTSKVGHRHGKRYTGVRTVGKDTARSVRKSNAVGAVGLVRLKGHETKERVLFFC